MKTTRKTIAKELLRMLHDGPAFDGKYDEFAYYRTQSWLKTWIIPAVKKLVPELKEKDKTK